MRQSYFDQKQSRAVLVCLGELVILRLAEGFFRRKRLPSPLSCVKRTQVGDKYQYWLYWCHRTLHISSRGRAACGGTTTLDRLLVALSSKGTRRNPRGSLANVPCLMEKTYST